MSTARVLTALTPWVAFVVLLGGDTDHRATVAAGAAAVLALLLLGQAVVRDGGPAPLELVAAIGFTALAGACAAGGQQLRHEVALHGPVEAMLTLALVMLASSLTRPFTEYYSRPDTPRAYLASPLFRAAHRRASLHWGLGTAAAAVLLLVL